MERTCSFPFCNFHLVGVPLLAVLAAGPALSQRENIARQGIITDWASQHVIFSNPGAMENALAKGKLNESERIVTEPRSQMQQFRGITSVQVPVGE